MEIKKIKKHKKKYISLKQREDKNKRLAAPPSEYISGSLRAPGLIT